MKIILNMYLKEKNQKKGKKLLYSRLNELIWVFYNFGQKRNGNSK